MSDGSRANAALMVAQLTARDLLRRPGTWTIALLTGVIFAAIFAGFGITSNRTQARAENISFAIAVDGDLAGGARFVEALRTSRLRIDPQADAAARVTASRATAGLTIPDDLDARIDRKESTEIKVYYREAQDNSQDALNTLLIRIQEIELDQRTSMAVDRTTVGPMPQLVEVATSEVRQDPRVTRNQFAATLAAMACILCLGTISSVTGLFGRSQEQRTLEPMLLLPLDRPTLAAGIAAGAFPVATLQLIGAQSLLIATTALPLAGLQQPLGEVLRMFLFGLAASVVLGALATVTGCAAGSIGVGTDDAVSLGDFLAIPFIAVGLLILLSPELPANLGTAVVPILGPALALRDAIRGTLGPGFAIAALVASSLWTMAILHFSGRRIANERRLLRATA